LSSAKKNIKGINPTFAKSGFDKKKSDLDGSTIANAIIQGDRTALGQGITLVESAHPKHQLEAQRLIEHCLPFSNNAVRIGITGVPGVGKSTFIEAFGNHLIQNKKKVAVRAVDPSSSISHGSILGDKTRMETLSQNTQAFIRPSASGKSLGGVARKTREAIILCEAAGFDIVIIETVGVGQSETMVHSMTDFFLLLKLAGAGDELQGIKRGIIEMADAIVINKADGENVKAAKLAKAAFAKALHLYPPKDSQWTPKVAICSALEQNGISEVWKMISTYLQGVKANNHFTANRNAQNRFWLLQTINDQLKDRFYNDPRIKKRLPEFLKAMENNEISPFTAATSLLNN